MPEQNKPFVVTDRRKFAMDGTPREDADLTPEPESRESVSSVSPEPPPQPAKEQPAPQAAPEQTLEADLPPAPTEEEMRQVNSAYQQTSDRLETAVRAANPGMVRPPQWNFDQIVESS
jgi:hypothetical protein